MMKATLSIPQDLTSVTKENMIEMIDFNSRIIGQLKDYLSRFEPLGVISPTIKKLSEEIELVDKASDIVDFKVDSTKTYSIEEIKGQVADKIKNVMEEDLAKLLEAINRLKNFINSPGLLSTVESEIDKAFDEI